MKLTSEGKFQGYRGSCSAVCTKKTQLLRRSHSLRRPRWRAGYISQSYQAPSFIDITSSEGAENRSPSKKQKLVQTACRMATLKDELDIQQEISCLTAAEEAVVHLSLQKHSVFLTGAAASGKTATLTEILRLLTACYDLGKIPLKRPNLPGYRSLALLESRQCLLMAKKYIHSRTSKSFLLPNLSPSIFHIKLNPYVLNFLTCESSLFLTRNPTSF